MANSARSRSTRTCAGVRRRRLRCRWPWTPIACPAATISAATVGWRSTCSPTRKNVARTPAASRTSSVAGVPRGWGPSSKLKATAPGSGRRSRTPSARRSAAEYLHGAGPACATASAARAAARLSWRQPMSPVALGAVAACAASCLYNLGVALQAMEARRMPAEQALQPSLLGDLARRPRWLAGTGLGLLGWPLQAAALLLAPLTVVQPGLAFGLILLLVLGARTLHERVERRDVAAVVAIIGGVAWLAAVAPPESSHHAGGMRLAAALVAVGALALIPYAVRRRGAVGGIAAALSAGTAFAWSGLSTKLVADAVSGSAWPLAVVWTLATGAASLLALLSEMTALQRRPVTQVAPVVFVVQVALPVLAAPLVTGESWAHAPLGPAGILVGLVVVLAGAIVLTSAPAVRSLVGEASSAESGTDGSVPPSEATAATVSAVVPSAVTTTTSPLDGRAATGRDASTVIAPATGDASTVRPTRY